MTQWTRERVIQVAPDPSSAKAGEGLANTRKWVSSGWNESAVWGECQGSGAKPYQVQVDLLDVAFKCSCPSRKFPCKHGIGLMLLFAAGEIAAAEQPAWVTQWLASRVQRKEKQAEKAADLSPEKQAERAESQEERRIKRVEKVSRGMDDLRLWLEDLVRAGLAAAPAKGFRFFEERAKRLVDAQAPGAARLVGEMGSAASSGDGWRERLLESAGLTYLLAEAALRLNTLPADLREDVLATLGFPTPKELLENAPLVHDTWQVIGREIEIEANLKTQRTHLFGVQTHRPALLLDFAYGNTALDATVVAGTMFPADLRFYPGQSVRAAMVASPQNALPLTSLSGLDSIAQLLDLHATYLATRPWLSSIAVPLGGVRPVPESGRWWIVDNAGDALPLDSRGRSAWMAMAVSAGNPVSVGVSTDGRTARLLSVVEGGTFTDLAAPVEASG
jgi:hypothetical protein